MKEVNWVLKTKTDYFLFFGLLRPHNCIYRRFQQEEGSSRGFLPALLNVTDTSIQNIFLSKSVSYGGCCKCHEVVLVQKVYTMPDDLSTSM